jgi:hypothetical protein
MAHFNGGNICSDSGGLLLQQAERITGIISQFADYIFELVKTGKLYLKRFKPFNRPVPQKNNSKPKLVRNAG